MCETSSLRLPGPDPVTARSQHGVFVASDIVKTRNAVLIEVPLRNPVTRLPIDARCSCGAVIHFGVQSVLHVNMETNDDRTIRVDGKRCPLPSAYEVAS